MIRNKMFLPNRGMGPIVFLVVVLAVMIGALLLSSGLIEEDQPVPREDRGASTTISLDTSPFDPKVADWGALDDRTELGLQSTPVAAFRKAAEIVALMPWGRMKDCGNSVRDGQFGFATLDAETILANPGAWRGVPVEVVGKLVEVADFDLFDAYDMKLPDGRYEVKQGVMRLRERAHGEDLPVRFTLIDDQTEDLPLLVPGTEVKIQGVFFKLHALDGKEGPETGCWLLAKRIFRSFDLPAEDAIDLGMLDYVRDAELAADASRSVFDEPPIFHLLSRVYHGFRDAEVVPMKGKETRALLERPKDFRGKVIKMQGRVIKIERWSMASWFPELSPEDGPISEFWITYVTSDGYVPLAVMWLEEPEVDLTTNNQVNLEAVFYRVWGYYNANGKATKAPLLVGRYAIQPLRIGGEGGLDPVSVGIAVFVVLALALVFLVLRHDRKRRALFEDTRRARKQLGRGPLSEKIAGPEEGAEGP